jgi:hypothetical protein
MADHLSLGERSRIRRSSRRLPLRGIHEACKKSLSPGRNSA